MKSAATPVGLLSLLVVAAVFLLVSLLVWERMRNASADPEARWALEESVEAIRSLPDGSPLLSVPPGASRASFQGELPGGPSDWSMDWSVQRLRWSVALHRFVRGTGDGDGPLLRLTVRVRRRRHAGSLAPDVAGVRSFLRAVPVS